MTTYLGKSCSFCLPRVPFVNCRQFMYLVISLLVLRAGYGIWLYQFLIIAYLLLSNGLCYWPFWGTCRSVVLIYCEAFHVASYIAPCFILFYFIFFQFCLTRICQVDSSTLIIWTSPFLILGGFGVLFHFFFFLYIFWTDFPFRKQWRPWSDGAFCGVWSASALFA